jgi:hypothetical protein
MMMVVVPAEARSVHISVATVQTLPPIVNRAPHIAIPKARFALKSAERSLITRKSSMIAGRNALSVGNFVR